MARTITQSVRVSATGLAKALHAAAAYTDGDKKSFRHRICLRVATWEHESKPDTDGQTTVEDRAGLIVAAGGPLRVIAVHASDVKDNDGEFTVDITPRAAALIVKVFAASTGEVTLRSDGKTLAVSATDAMFDNQRVEVRALPTSPGSDALVIAQRTETLCSVYCDAAVDTDSVQLTNEASIAITAASKALGIGPALDIIALDGPDLGARVRYGTTAVGYVRAYDSRPVISPAWEQILDTTIEDAWLEPAVKLQHLLDGALPSAPPPGLSLATASGLTVSDAGGVDLETYQVDEPVTLTAVPDAFADDDTEGAA